MNDFNNNKNQLNETLLVNFALSLQKHTKIDIDVSELADFISNTADEPLRHKVLAALNYSPALMQQWLDINHTLGNLSLEQQVQSVKPASFLSRFMRFVTRPWFIPATALALALMVFVPPMLQPDSQDLLDGIYQQLPSSQYESKSFAPQLDGSTATSQEDLFDRSLYFGSRHWHYYKNNHEKLQLPDLCKDSTVNNCQKIQKIARRLGQVQGIVESSCYKLDDVKLWQDIEKIAKIIRKEVNALSLDFEPQIPDLTQGFCE